MNKVAQLYDPIYETLKDYAQESAQLLELIKQKGALAGTTLLDVGCGTGQHLAHLRKHFKVEGIDLDPDMLSLAAERLPGVQLHQGDMRKFDLGRTFDVVVCLFSSIGYTRSLQGLREAVRTMARHLKPGGLLIVEPWLTPDGYVAGIPHGAFVDRANLKIARLDVSVVRRRLSVLDFHYLVATPTGVERFRERNVLGLFSRDEYLKAFELAGLLVSFDQEGLIGRGLYIAEKSPSHTMT